jgi:hypothetical protein
MAASGPFAALSYHFAVDDLDRFTWSKKAEPWVGFTPSRRKFGEKQVLPTSSTPVMSTSDGRCAKQKHLC